MIIDRIDGCFHEAHMTFDDIQYIVCASNIAGRLEAKGIIHVVSDMQLTEFILDKFTHWFDEEWKDIPFQDYITHHLIKKFELEED